MKRSVLSAALAAAALAASFIVFGGATMASADTWTLLNGVTTAGAGRPYDLGYGPFSKYSCEVELSDNSTSAVVVAIEGNQSCGPRYAVMAEFTLTTNERAAQIGAFSIVDMPARCIRARLKTLTGGASTAVTVRCTGVK
jgi:hypothetical protein